MIYERETWQTDKNGRLKRKHSLLSRRNTKQRARALAKLKEHEIEWNARLAIANPSSSQLTNLIKKFGGIVNFAIAVGETPDHILWRWLRVSGKKPYKVTTMRYGRMRLGQAFGIVPYFHLLRILRAARYMGILLTPEDIFPELITGDKLRVSIPEGHAKDFATWTRRTTGSNAKDTYKEFEDLIAKVIEPE